MIHYILVIFCLCRNKEPQNIKIGHFKWSKLFNNFRRVTLDGNETNMEVVRLTNNTLADGREYDTI